MNARNRWWSLLATILAMCLVTGCVSLPDSGTVRTAPVGSRAAEANVPFFDPPGPRPDHTPVQIVRGFLDAMTANPLTTAVAREYLTDEASNSWAPETRTLIYGSSTLVSADDSVTMQFASVAALDGRGEWLGPTEGGRYVQRITMVREKGEWRISNPPDALIVPETYFESRFRQFSLYFFDKSAQVLVPEPVYLPSGEQTPTLLTRGLLEGPDQELLGVTRTFIPASAKIDLSVPVSSAGVAVVPFSDDILDLDPERLRLISAQVLWTLRQVVGVQAVQFTVDGSPVEVPGVGTTQEVGSWAEYDPRVRWASEELFGLRDDRVVTLVDGEPRRISGLFGTEPLGLRTIAVDLPAGQVAGVTSGGTSVLVAPRSRKPGTVPTRADADTIFSAGTDLLQPAWDLYGQVWLVDNTADGAVLSVVRPGAVTAFEAPGISGRAVKEFELSRDGTRLVAVISGTGGDRLVVARVMRDESGRVRKVGPAENLPVGDIDLREIRDVAWRSPESVALLSGPETGLSQVIIASVDGSTALSDLASNPEVFRSEAARIVTSPSEGAPLYVGTISGQLFELASNGRWTGTSIGQGLSSPTFVG